MAKSNKIEYKKRYKESAAIELVALNARRYRLEKGLSMEKLANIMNVEYAVLARLETGKTNASISLVYGIAKALDIEPHLMLMPEKL